MESHWKIDHLGIAVRDLAKASSFYLSLPGHEFVEEEVVPEHKVRVLFLRCGPTLIELLEPTDESSPLAKFIQKRGEGLHHICYRVLSVGDELRRLKEQGRKLVDELPRPGSRGMQVAFLHPQASSSGVLIELCSP